MPEAEEEVDVFDKAAADLEKSIQQDTKPTEPASLIDAITKAATDFVNKGKGGNSTDLPAEKDKRGTLTESGKDPAETPVKSGQGYKDSTKYEARKGHDDDEDDDKDDDDDDTPSFFKKKKKKKHGKKVAKADDEGPDDEEDDDEVMDATEFVEGIGNAVDHLGKSTRRLEEGLACFGELLADLADPRKDKLDVSIAKGLSFLIEKVTKLEKAMEAQNTLIKSVATMPGVPRVAGLHAIVESAAGEGGETTAGKNQLTKAQRDRLFTLAVQKKITTDDVKKAVQTGDATILDSFKA